MLAAFKYALKKPLRLKSTWIVVAISLPLIFGLAGILPFNTPSRGDAPASNFDLNFQGEIIAAYAAGVSTVGVALIAVFAGLRGATLFRDEVEDGSLLIIISKPVGRSQLMLAKWLAALTSMLVFTLALAITHAFGVLAGSDGRLEASQFFLGLVWEWTVGAIFALLVIGVAMIVSVWLSAKQTAIISLGVGILASLTAILQPLTTVDRSINAVVKSFQNYMLVGYRYDRPDGVFNTEAFEDTSKRLIGILQPDGPGTPAQRAELLDSLIAIDALPVGATAEYAASSDGQSYLLASLFDRQATPWGPKEDYFTWRYIDINGQLSTLSAYVAELFYGREQVDYILAANGGQLNGLTSPFELGTVLTPQAYNRVFDATLAISPYPTGTANTYEQKADHEAFIAEAFENFEGPNGPVYANGVSSVYSKHYGRYLEPGNVAAGYLIVGFLLVGLALFVLRRTDFR